MYSMCQSKFERMAREAKATYKLDKLVLVNTELFEKYLESFRIVEQSIVTDTEKVIIQNNT